MELGQVIDVNEEVMRAGLAAMGEALRAELESGTYFALFVDWCDGQPISYVSDVARPTVVEVLSDWLSRNAHADSLNAAADLPTVGHTLPGVAPWALESKCATLGKSMVEEDVDVVLFLITEIEVAWFSSMARGREFVEEWVREQKGRN
jgi:hypothetical protein